MKLIFDENLSPDLVSLLADLFPGSISAGLSNFLATKNFPCWSLDDRLSHPRNPH
jgi:hypothetical protein